jgi:type IV fimbrial biogenesis protein FimT
MRRDRHKRKLRVPHPAAQRGFTLVEMMVAITIMSILLAIAIPNFNNAILGSKLSGYANNLVASAFLARGEAIKRNAVVTLCVSTNGTTCATGGWEQGWIVLAGTEVLQRQPVANPGFKFTGTVSTVRFQPTGVGSDQAAITICRATPTAGDQERVVSISATGRASTAKTTTGTCT